MEKKKRQVVDHHVETFSFPFLTATSTMQSCGALCGVLDLDLIFQFFNIYFLIETSHHNQSK